MKIKSHTISMLKKETFEKHVDLLLLSNPKDSHYVSVKCFDRFMTNKAK